MYKLSVDPEINRKITAQEMEVGDIAEVIEGGYDGHIVLKDYNHVVSLSNPRSTWDNKPHFKVRLLPPGSRVTLIIE